MKLGGFWRAGGLALMLLQGCSGADREPADELGFVSRDACAQGESRPWCDPALAPARRAELLVAAMSLEQKIDYLAGDDPQAPATCDPYCGVVNGIAELGIPPLRMSDGPVGARGSPATALPVPLALAASFAPELAYRTGALVGNEVRHKGNDLVHAPVADLIRNPLAGRSFETFGEDPWLASRMTVQWVRGTQDQGVLGNLKHYLMNTQEGIGGVPPLVAALGGRNLVNVVIDERSLREIYLPPYEAAVKEADVASMMCAYNYVNGEPACASTFLLQQVLREDWGFDGFFVTDYYFAQKDTIQTANTSPMIEMPYGFMYHPALLQTAVASGQVSEQTLDVHLQQIFRTLFRFGFFDRPRYQRDDAQIDQIAHAQIARETAEQGAVLLRNQGALPIDAQVKHIAVIGVSATERPSGGGSSFVTPFRFISPLEGIRERAGAGTTVDYIDGRDPDAAAALATEADLAIVFANSISTEGVDKFCLALDCTLADVPDALLLNAMPAGASEVLDLVLDPVLSRSPVAEALEQAFAPILLGGQPMPVSHRNQDQLISQVAAANPATVVVLQTGGPVLTPWREAVNAILEIWFAGQEAGPAVAGLLFGDVDPGGRLPVSFPQRETDTPVAGDARRYPGIANQAEHSEGVFIGYRWLDAQGIEPAYAFGFGLSYGEFELSGLVVDGVAGETLVVTAEVENVGERGGWTVPQLYLGLPEPRPAVAQPPRALKGFAKHWLAPGERRSLRFELSARDLSYWDEEQAGWVLAPGCYRVMLGHSSRDLPLQGSVPLGGGVCS